MLYFIKFNASESADEKYTYLYEFYLQHFIHKAPMNKFISDVR